MVSEYADASAAGAISTELSVGYPEYPPLLHNYGLQGEMGGKRKKMPHERAGWVEMDMEGPRKRGRKKTTGDNAAAGPSGASGSGSGGEYAAPTAEKAE